MCILYHARAKTTRYAGYGKKMKLKSHMINLVPLAYQSKGQLQCTTVSRLGDRNTSAHFPVNMAIVLQKYVQYNGQMLTGE